jgi:hypothetical protein
MLGMGRAPGEEHSVITRVKWVLENRQGPSGKPWSKRGLSLAAGLSAQYVEQVVAGRIDPDGIGAKTLAALASAGQVNVEWLRTGQGPRDTGAAPILRVVESEDPYPSREQFFDIARGEGADETILRAIRRVKRAEGDPGSVEFWRAEYKRLVQEQKAFRKDLRSIDDLDEG